MNSPTINFHIERVLIDEAVHRAGPDAVLSALAAQLPALLFAGGAPELPPAAITATAESVAGRLPTSTPPRQP